MELSSPAGHNAFLFLKPYAFSGTQNLTASATTRLTFMNLSTSLYLSPKMRGLSLNHVASGSQTQYITAEKPGVYRLDFQLVLSAAANWTGSHAVSVFALSGSSGTTSIDGIFGNEPIYFPYVDGTGRQNSGFALFELTSDLTFGIGVKLSAAPSTPIISNRTTFLISYLGSPL